MWQTVAMSTGENHKESEVFSSNTSAHVRSKAKLERRNQDWDFALAEWNRLQKRRIELAHKRQSDLPVEEEPWYAELEAIEEKQAILELALGAYEFLAQDDGVGLLNQLIIEINY